jgi:hypothetical protein
MTHEENQRLKEKEVFGKFAGVCPLDIKLDSIETQNPPKPDIICQLADGSEVEYELGEAVDQQYQRRTNLSINQTLLGMRDYYDKMPESEKKDKLRRLYGDALINLTFKENATKTKRENAYPKIFGFLLNLEDDFSGDVDTNLQSFPKLCVRINIVRGNSDGPEFNENPASHISSGVLEVIKSKFSQKKSYETSGRLELLVHSYNKSIKPKQVWISNVKEYVEENIDYSKFERVWVFDYDDEEIEYVYPELTIS